VVESGEAQRRYRQSCRADTAKVRGAATNAERICNAGGRPHKGFGRNGSRYCDPSSKECEGLVAARAAPSATSAARRGDLPRDSDRRGKGTRPVQPAGSAGAGRSVRAAARQDEESVRDRSKSAASQSEPAARRDRPQAQGACPTPTATDGRPHALRDAGRRRRRRVSKTTAGVDRRGAEDGARAGTIVARPTRPEAGRGRSPDAAGSRRPETGSGGSV